MPGVGRDADTTTGCGKGLGAATARLPGGKPPDSVAEPTTGRPSAPTDG
ncbi:hypothetical protein O1L60_38450 [Streptomyces diastatochromogenes]|nr:hypothetical protein [Streptomyces diastatochromogenes]